MPLNEDLFLVVVSHLTVVLAFGLTQLVVGTFVQRLTAAVRDSQFVARLDCTQFEGTRS